MARKKLVVTEEPNLEELINIYSENKSEMDNYKKICNDSGSKIKQLMMAEDDLKVGENKWEKTSGKVKASVIVAVTQSFNEEALLEVIKQSGAPGIVKTKEYVDLDSLESAIYAGELSKEVLEQINNCREIKETTQLRLTKLKGE